MERQKIREQQKAERIANFSPEKREKYLKKKEEKERYKSLSVEEKAVIKAEKKKTRIEKKERFAFLSNNWSEELPGNSDFLIVDGNNIRGGGPKRFSRNDIIAILSNFKTIHENIEILCVFDHMFSKHDVVPGIEVKFSEGDIADDMIIDIIEDQKERSIVLVTCDRGLALRALDLGSNVMRNKRFISLSEK